MGITPRLKVTADDGFIVEQRDFGAAQGTDHGVAVREIIATGRTLLRGEPVAAFGHRVVTGGVQSFDIELGELAPSPSP